LFSFFFFLSLLLFYLKNNNNKKDTFVVFRIQFYIFRILFLGKLPIYRSFIGIKQSGGEKHWVAIFFSCDTQLRFKKETHVVYNVQLILCISLSVKLSGPSVYLV
jgi:hypothetical protein